MQVQKKVTLERHPTSSDKYEYEVVSADNTVKPAVGDFLSEAQVHDLWLSKKIKYRIVKAKK